ncbi:MAG: DUF89 family protein [Nitrospirae bacterium]|nr:DUF89 family protein [Nitrospirota bacterium]
MKVHLDCYPCFLRQTVIALRLGTKDEELQRKILAGILNELHLMDVSKTPAHATTFMHRTIRQMLGRDPFREIKSEYTQIALNLYPTLKSLVMESKEPIWTATRLAIAGNVIDFGIFTSVDIQGTVKKALGGPIGVDDYSWFKEAINTTDNILYLLDNTGESVFDRLLIETLTGIGKKVTAVVKGSPVLNDCTIEDAVEAGIREVCEVIDNGSDAVGTILESTSQEFKGRFQRADCIIAKGQGNFETLMDLDKKIFFLFQSKCDVVSKVLGLARGSMLLKGSP